MNISVFLRYQCSFRAFLTDPDSLKEKIELYLSVEIFHGKRKGKQVPPQIFLAGLIPSPLHPAPTPPNFWQVRLEIDLQDLLTLAPRHLLLAAD